jgi:hypothetical protein
LNDLVWRNKYKRKEAKSEIGNVTVPPIMTYALETITKTQKPDKFSK